MMKDTRNHLVFDCNSATNVSNGEIDQIVIDTKSASKAARISNDEDRLSLVEPSLRRELVLVDTLTAYRC